MIVIEIPAEEKENALKYFSGIPDVTAVEAHALNGTDTISLLINLTPVVVYCVVKMYGEYLKAKKSMLIKHNGFVIRGYSEREVKKLLEAFMQEEGKEKEGSDKKGKNKHAKN